MGEIKLNPRDAAALLDKLDEGARGIEGARDQIFEAMADRRVRAPLAATNKPERDRRSRKKR